MKIKHILLHKPFALLILLVLPSIGFAQEKKTIPATSSNVPPAPIVAPKTGIKPFKEVITDKAITKKGLFTVHRIEDKWWIEIPDSLMGRDLLVVNRLSKAAAGMRNLFFGYAGDQIGNNVIRFEKGPSNKIFLKKIAFDEWSKDSTMPMYQAVTNSNIQPIAAAFDIACFTKDSSSAVVEMSNYINSDNDVLNFSTNSKPVFQIGGHQPDKSYIVSLKTYPTNLEIKTVKTYTKGSGIGTSLTAPSSPFGNTGSSGQLLTVEINSSVLLLPKTPMRQRFFDPRVGYFSRSYTDFDANPQGVKQIATAVRWRLEPKKEDIEKYKKGELVEPQKPIVYYIDPATPKKWVPYLIQGVNDWQVAFEKAGFKNAIIGKLAPTPKEDSTWSLEDARFSAIVYKPSDIPNASGPNVHDPRSGEILESHINWYHNVMKLLRNWYFIQCAPNDPRARKMEFEDSLMGQLIRFVSSHEVGHTLGLRHNYGSSSTVPVEKLRDKNWVETNGHTPSIMDYARFNYVAQPEDNIDPKGLCPRINDYDKWAIEWGYKLLLNNKDAQQDAIELTQLTTQRLQANKRLWFGTEANAEDPRSQSEDLGDNAMKASVYGIKNLQRIMPNLIAWTKNPHEDFSNLNELYKEIVAQYSRYAGHVMKNIGGIMETPKMTEQTGAVYEYTPKARQKEALAFLDKYVFATPTWLINNEVYSKIGGGGALSTIGSKQETLLGNLLSTDRLSRLMQAEAAMSSGNTYTLIDCMADVQKILFTELATAKPIDAYRRNLQKAYIEKMASLVNPTTGGLFGGIVFSFGVLVDVKKTDIPSVAKGNLRSLKTLINAALPATTDKMSRYHLQDIVDRINKILDPK
jgi:hypothetical protein